MRIICSLNFILALDLSRAGRVGWISIGIIRIIFNKLERSITKQLLPFRRLEIREILDIRTHGGKPIIHDNVVLSSDVARLQIQNHGNSAGMGRRESHKHGSS
jgi:hypothetical protein